MTVEELKQRRHQIEVHRAHVVEQLDDHQLQRDDRDDQLRLFQGAELFCAAIQQALVDPSFTTKQQVLQLVVDRIVVPEDEIVVHHSGWPVSIANGTELEQASRNRRLFRVPVIGVSRQSLYHYLLSLLRVRRLLDCWMSHFRKILPASENRTPVVILPCCEKSPLICSSTT